MQRCANCGAELAENARFCGNCGAVPPPPQSNPWFQQQPSMQQPQQAGWPQPTPAQQQPSQVGGGWPQPTPAPMQQPSQVNGGGWPQPTPAQQPPMQSGAWQPSPSQAGWPQPASEQFYAQAQSAPPGQPAPQMQPGMGWQQQQPPYMPPPGGPKPPEKRSSFPRWIFIALIVVLLIGGGVTAFALINHHSSPTATTPHTTPTSTSGQTATTGTTPVTGTTPILAGGSPVPTLSALPSCPTGFSRTGSFSFSGTVTGQMAITEFAACGPITVTENGVQVKEYVGVAIGTIGVKAYEFIFGAFPYNNPGTFQSIEIVGRLTDTGSSQVWQDILGAAPGTVTVNADGKSGTLDITMPLSQPTADANNTVKVTGSWSS